MSRKAFTLVELLVTVAVIALLAALLLPALAKAKGTAKKTACATNLRQLGMTTQIYADDHDGQYPSRRIKWNWVSELIPPPRQYPEYLTPPQRRCPSDNEEPKLSIGTAELWYTTSYIMNGFTDVLFENLGHSDWLSFVAKGTTDFAVKQPHLSLPSETVLFGEKRINAWNWYLDLLTDPQYFYFNLEEGRHGGDGRSHSTGNSNYLFADGSVRSIHYGNTICPLNSWAVYPKTRSSTALCIPH